MDTQVRTPPNARACATLTPPQDSETHAGWAAVNPALGRAPRPPANTWSRRNFRDVVGISSAAPPPASPAPAFGAAQPAADAAPRKRKRDAADDAAPAAPPYPAMDDGAGTRPAPPPPPPPASADGAVAALLPYADEQEKYFFRENYALVCAVCELNPYCAPQGQTRARWARVVARLGAAGFFAGKTDKYLKCRINDLIKLKEAPGYVEAGAPGARVADAYRKLSKRGILRISDSAVGARGPRARASAADGGRWRAWRRRSTASAPSRTAATPRRSARRASRRASSRAAGSGGAGRARGAAGRRFSS